jgi:hypothetical protein
MTDHSYLQILDIEIGYQVLNIYMSNLPLKTVYKS